MKKKLPILIVRSNKFKRGSDGKYRLKVCSRSVIVDEEVRRIFFKGPEGTFNKGVRGFRSRMLQSNNEGTFAKCWSRRGGRLQFRSFRARNIKY